MSVIKKKGKHLQTILCLVLTICLLLGQTPFTAVAVNDQEVSITGIAAGTYRSGLNDWYIVVEMDAAAFTMPSVAGLKATVDETEEAQVWFQSNAAMGEKAGRLAFTLETTKAEHTVTIPEGTVLGSYSLKKDFVFQTHADGTLTAVDEEPEETEPTQPEEKTVSVTGIATGTFRSSDWYIILNVNDSSFKLTSVVGLKTPVDDTTAQVWFQSNAAMGESSGKLIFTLETTKAEHTVTIPAGTALGEYTLKEDCVIYTHADGTLTVAGTEPIPTEPEVTEPEPTHPEKNEVSITGIAKGAFRTNDWYIILNVDDNSFKMTSVAGLKATVDGGQAQVWFQSNAAMGEGSGKLIFTLETTKADHTVTIPAGTALGEYTLKDDFVFYTHPDGTLTAANDDPLPTEPEVTEPEPTQPETKEVTLTGVAAGTFRTTDWYIVLNADPSKFTMPAVAGLKLSVDDGLSQAWLQSNAAMGEGSGKLMFTLETTKSEHTVTIPAGTILGEYTVTEDFVFYTYADGTVGVTPPEEPVNFTFHSGTWQSVPESNLARYLIWLEDDTLGEISVPWTALDSLTVDGEKRTAYATMDSDKVLLILDQETGITQPGKYTITLQKGTYIGIYQIAQDITIYTDGLKVSTVPPVQIPDSSETVTPENDSRNLNGECTTGFYFSVTPADLLPYDEHNGTISYGAAEGGIYVNGELTPVTITKWLSNLYYVPLREFGYPPQKGDVVTVDGVFGNGDHAVTYTKQSFVYDGEGNWEIGTYLRDLREQEYIIQDISELKMGLSEFALEPGVTLIGEAKRGINIAIRTVVSTNLGADEFNFGFSKIDGMWDTQKSGWQVWLRPETNQVFLAHGESNWQATSYYEFTQKEFTVEFGTVNMDEYIDGENAGLYCRKIYLKINGEEVLSYKDTDLTRNVGKKLYVLNSEDAEGSKLISLTSKGVKLRELEPTVYDYFDLTGFAADTVTGGKTVLLGETATSSNVAVRMRMNLSTDATEVRLALSKQEKDNFWDAAGSGWQVWLRPKWDGLYIAHGENEFEVVERHSYKNSFDLEIGVRDVIVEKEGKKIGDYCRKVYVLIDGQEVAAWEDTDFNRTLGNCVMLLTSQDSPMDVFTQQYTVELPVQIVVNGETAGCCDLIKINAQAVQGKDTKISLVYSSDSNHKTTFHGLYRNGEKLEPLEESDGKVIYLLENPSQSDQLKAELTVKSLTTDDPSVIYDLFDLANVGVMEIPAQTTVSIGAMVDKNGQAAVNSAVRFAIRFPQSFNQAQITILGDSSGPWSTSGAMLQIIPNQINFCHPATMTRMDSFASELFAPGSLVCVEFGVVKCYEDGIYKYDRWYVRAGEIAEEMELVGWFDSIERGHYGAHFCCRGTDLEESYYLYSLKNVYSLTDESSAENKALLRTYQQLTNTLPELYYPKALIGYSTLEQAEQQGRISFYTVPGTKLSRFTVNGVDVTDGITVGADGAYCYTLSSVTEDVRFAYEITADDTRYTVTAGGDDKLQFSLPEDGVLAGEDLSFAVTGQKGYVPQVTVNGTDILLTVNEETGVWYGTVKSIRRDTEIIGKAVEKSYTVSVNTPNNGSVTLGGDAENGKLPFGGRLEVTVQPDSGCYIQSVLINGVQMSADENGTVILEAVYWDTESIAVETVFAKANIPVQEHPQNSSLTYIWIAIAILAIAAAAGVTVLLLKRKPKEGKMKK